MSLYDIHSSTRNTIVSTGAYRVNTVNYRVSIFSTGNYSISTGEYIVSIVPLVMVLFPVENIYASGMPLYLYGS